MKKFLESWNIVNNAEIEDNEIRVLLKILSFGNGISSANCMISHFYNLGIENDSVPAVLEKMVNENILSKNNCSSPGNFCYSIKDTTAAWQRILLYDIKYVKICPTEIAEKLGYNKIKNLNSKTGLFENNKYNMKNLQNWEKFNENYPPGAEHDPSAPWNQKEPDYETEKFDDFIENDDGDKFPVSIEYTYYYESPDSLRKQISEYSHEFKADASSIDLDKDSIDDIVRELITQNIGDRYYDWQC